MRDRIKAAAEANNRSMNAEIVATLEEKYPAPALDAALLRIFELLWVADPEKRRALLKGFAESLAKEAPGSDPASIARVSALVGEISDLVDDMQSGKP